ncbi:M48 family metalloprotease [Tenacibaculum soleae]|uniref:M48 family metalloprotease n=1 Tax=Tenacibaculum soleae TaxID=447689 RepID=UPI0023016E7F|nr:M48 family metalloprotease [Tenacibaculum soleae]
MKPIAICKINGKNRSTAMENMIKKRGFNYPVFIIPIKNNNAYAFGIFRRYKIILITQGMIDNLEEKDVESILLHEIGHHKKNHVFYYSLAFLVFNFIYAIVIVIVIVFVQFLFGKNIENQILYMPFVMGVYGGLTYYILIIKKNKEFEADLFSAEIVGKDRFINALNNFNRITSGKLEKESITHPKLSERINYVKENS